MIKTAPIEGFQLSKQQLRLWRLLARNREAQCWTRIAIELDGAVDPEEVRTALAGVVARHEILRTTFKRLPGMAVPVQVIAEAAEFDWHFASERQPNQGSSGAKEQPFDVENGPLLRASLQRVNPHRHRLTLTVCGLCADPATAGILAEDFAREYAGLADNEQSPEPPMQYADYAAWQSEATTNDVGQKFWIDQELSALAELKLPMERGSAIAAEPSRVTLDLESETLSRLQRLANALNCRVADLLLCAWVVLLARLSQQSSVGVSVYFDGRSMQELKQGAGPYARFLPMVCPFDPCNSMQRLVGELQNILRRAYEWQECFAGEKVESVANTPASVSPVAFQFLEIPALSQVGQLAIQVTDLVDRGEPFRLKLVCARRESNLRLELQGTTCDVGDAERLLEEFSTVINGLLADPTVASGQVPILGPMERDLVTRIFNRTAAPVPEVCIHSLIERQVQANPESCAVACGQTRITYRELNLRANDLGAALQKLGVGPDVPVGICLDRSVELIVGILGILKAGGCYVPLDPAYPQERLQFMLADTNAPVLLTVHGKTIPPFAGKILYLDEEPLVGLEDPRVGIPLSKAQPDSTAYIIYTSGSTGQPKGVPIRHRNLVNSTFARIGYYPHKVGRYLLLSSFAFDSSVAGIFWTLSQGGTLILPPDGTQQDPGEIVRLLSNQQITHLLCLPSLYNHILERSNDQVGSLQTVIVAGEACPPALVEHHRTKFPRVDLYNEYGPTEATVWSTVYDCSEAPKPGAIPIGKPIANCRVYVLDTNQEPVPVHVPGEIYIGGHSVAAGYLNRPELTVEKFVPDLFEPRQGAHLYRTGDLGCYRADGNLEFLGRIDQQVKIRGYRVELEEIEAVLRQHGGVRDAVVVLENRPSTEAGPAGAEELALQLENRLDAEALLQAIESEVSTNPLQNGSGGHIEAPANGESAHSSAGENNIWTQRRASFDVTLRVRDQGFIKPPRDSQRQWLITRAMSELAEDLETLHQLAARFVPGTELGPELFKTDRTQARLTNDEIIQDWHAPLMKAMAEALVSGGEDILEIGFGRGIAASFLQQRKPRSHTIIECNDFVIAEHFAPWQKQHPAADIRLVRGKWQEVISSLPAFDGIFFQTYPLNEAEFFEYLAHSATFAEHFFSTASEHLRTGGGFTYLSHEIDSLSRRHQRLLFKHFRSFQLSLQSLQLPQDCQDLWWSNAMVVVKAVK